MFNDDEQPIAPAPNAGRPALGFSDAGKASVKEDHAKEAPLAATTVSVLLDVSSSSSTMGRAPLDLVVVLDVSGSMGGSRLEQLKSAMQFVIKKLSPMDRLSIVTFSTESYRACALRVMSDAAKSDLKGIIEGLVADGATNIKAGLETGLRVLADRKYINGRTGNLLLMSDGEQNRGGDARQVANPMSVPVYSLAFGSGADTKLLQDLSVNGGTFNPVPESGSTGMLAVFSQLLAGLLTVVVQDLYLILSKPTSVDNDLDKIVKVAPGDFIQETDGQSGTVTVKFGDLFSGEVRKVVVDLLLIEASSDYQSTDILDIAVSYPDSNGNRQIYRVRTLQISRSGTATSVTATPKLVAENARRQHADSIAAARSLADRDDLEQARDKLVEAQNALEDILDQANPMVAMLRTELQQLLDRMESPELYKAEGRSYALAAETSHARQRFASRGDVEGVRLFATPRMDAYIEQAKKYAENPDAPVPTADDDAAEEIKANPMAAIVGSLAFYIHAAVEALRAIEKIVTAAAACPGNV